MATASTAEEDWELVADEFTPAFGEDRRTAGPALRDARYYRLLLAEGHLTRGCFGSMLRRVTALPQPDGYRTRRDSEPSAQKRPSRGRCQRPGRLEVRNRPNKSVKLPNEPRCDPRAVMSI